MQHVLKFPFQRLFSFFSIIAIHCAPFISRAQETAQLPEEPVAHAGFGVKPLDEQYVIAYWTIDANQANTRFAVERSNDGISFETVEQVDGQIAGKSRFQYSYLDQKPHAGTSYYRLRITSGDKEVSYSMAVRVQLKQTQLGLQIAPGETDSPLTASTKAPKSPMLLQQAP